MFLLQRRGITDTAALIAAAAGANAGAASNLKAIITAIFTGSCPSSPSIAGPAARAVGGLMRTNPDLDVETCDYLTALRFEPDARSQDRTAIEREDRQLEIASVDLGRTLDEYDGLYGYSYATYLRTVQKTDPERFLIKIGCTDRTAGVRIRDQPRATAMPEDPLLLRNHGTIRTRGTLSPDPRVRRPQPRLRPLRR
jgi:hypothetical protein